MIGASIYLSQDLISIKRYLFKLSNLGVKEIFTSIHINEENEDGALNKLREVSLYIRKLKMNLMIDISSSTLKKYDMTFEDLMEYLSSIQVSKLRIDFGFTNEEIVKLSKKFDIVLNASTIDDNQCKNLEFLGLELNNIIVCHNFYPRPETGLSEKIFFEQNKYLKQKGFKIQAFLAGDEKFREPIYSGLPTLEKHRYKDPLFVYIELTRKYCVDEVLVGDIAISDFSLERIKEYEDNKVILLRTRDVNIIDDRLKSVFWGEHINRMDVSDYVIRSAKTRELIKFEIDRFNNVRRELGTITIDNKLYGRYNGELQITKKDLDRDDRVNVLGYINGEDLSLLDYVLGGVKFRFI